MAPLGCQLTCPHWTRGLRLKHGNTEDLEAPRTLTYDIEGITNSRRPPPSVTCVCYHGLKAVCSEPWLWLSLQLCTTGHWSVVTTTQPRHHHHHLTTHRGVRTTHTSLQIWQMKVKSESPLLYLLYHTLLILDYMHIYLSLVGYGGSIGLYYIYYIYSIYYCLLDMNFSLCTMRCLAGSASLAWTCSSLSHFEFIHTSLFKSQQHRIRRQVVGCCCATIYYFTLF